MGRQPSVAGGRPVVVTVRLSKKEAEAMDRARGGLSRSAFGRSAIMRASIVSREDPTFVMPED